MRSLGLTGAHTYERGEPHAEASHDDFFVELLFCRQTFVAAQWDFLVEHQNYLRSPLVSSSRLQCYEAAGL